MTSAHDLSTAAWRKSSYSNGSGGACVQVSGGFPGMVPVRDSKDPEGPALVFPAESWASFVAAVKDGAFPSFCATPWLEKRGIPDQPRAAVVGD